MIYRLLINTPLIHYRKVEKWFFMLVGMCSFLLTSCDDNELLPDFIYEMTLSQEVINVVPEGADEVIEVNSNYTWSAESNATWCRLSNGNGTKGTSSFSISVDRNYNIEERTAEVTVTAGSVVRKIKVVQMNPNGFEIVDLPLEVAVDGLESVIELQVKTNMLLTVSSEDNWIVPLDNDIIAGNPPKVASVRIMVNDNVTDSPRSTVVKINGDGLPDNYAKSFTVTQGVAPVANMNDERVIGTWLVTKVVDGVTSNMDLLGTTMKFEPDGQYSEVLASGQTNMGSWNVRGNRLAIYYTDNTRRYIYINDTANGITGTMTNTDINSSLLYDSHLSPYSGDGFGVSIVDLTNTKFTYMIVMNGDVNNISESGLCISQKENPTVSDKKYVSKGGGSVAVGEISDLNSGDSYHIRGYRMEGSQIVYTADTRIDMPVRDIDGNDYKMVKIGNQYWLAENLKTSKYRDGSPLEYCDKNHVAEWVASGDTQRGAFSWIFGEDPDWVWAEDDFNNGVTDRRAKSYGAIYNWHAVVDERKLAPEGWHIPSKEEFVTLLSSIGASTDDFAGGDLNYMNGLLAHDHYQNITGWTGWAVSGRSTDGSWKSWGSLSARETTWWSSDISDSGYPWLIYHRRGDSGDSGISWTYQNEGWTVRCIRD